MKKGSLACIICIALLILLLCLLYSLNHLWTTSSNAAKCAHQTFCDQLKNKKVLYFELEVLKVKFLVSWYIIYDIRSICCTFEWVRHLDNQPISSPDHFTPLWTICLTHSLTCKPSEDFQWRNEDKAEMLGNVPCGVIEEKLRQFSKNFTRTLVPRLFYAHLHNWSRHSQQTLKNSENFAICAVIEDCDDL